MVDIQKLLKGLKEEETQFLQTQFLAPCLKGGQVRTKMGKMIYTFKTQPVDFTGWGMFQPINESIAQWIEEPSLAQVDDYLNRLKPLRLYLVYELEKQTWLGYPVNESDMQQRVGKVQPVVIHLVNEGSEFERIIGRYDGVSFWFQEVDRRADPSLTDSLKAALKKYIAPEQLHFKGLTPEMRIVYQLMAKKNAEVFQLFQQKENEERLKSALQMGGGILESFKNREDYWLVEWTTSDGEHHQSAIAKHDLTVMTAGICLSGFDRDFDLQSLVGVVENR